MWAVVAVMAAFVAFHFFAEWGVAKVKAAFA
jgi:hypothetical protein